MALVGDVAEERDLVGETGSVSELIKVFRMRQGVLVGSVLPGVEERVNDGVAKQRARILKTIENLLGHPRLPSEWKDVHQALYTLQADYVCAELDERYDQVSLDLFKLQRKVSVEKEGREYDVVLPLFAKVPFGSQGGWQSKLDSKESYPRLEVYVEAQSPPLTPEVKEGARLMRAAFEEAYAQALRVPLLGDLLMGDLERFNTGGGLSLDVHWIPKASELKITVEERADPDPILIGRAYGRNYLVAQWDVKGELPYQHYLAEFKE